MTCTVLPKEYCNSRSGALLRSGACQSSQGPYIWANSHAHMLQKWYLHHIPNLKSSCRDSDVDNGFYSDIADSLGAIQVWPEHRYYGSAPNRPADKTYEHLNIEQALVDQIELVLDIQRSYRLSLGPVIAIGSSYSKLHSL